MAESKGAPAENASSKSAVCGSLLFAEALPGKVNPDVSSAIQQTPIGGEFHCATCKFSRALTYKREPQID